MRFNPTTLSIWINTYNRPRELEENVVSLRDSIGYEFEINIISNHTQCPLNSKLKANVIFNNLRPNESWGFLARNWNQCIYLGLSKTEFALISQDDVTFKKGWLELLNQFDNFDFYSAPIGDLIHLTSRDTFLNVGWWDERFVGIDYQDYDYLNRVYHSIRDRSSVVDEGLGWSWNDIGLSNYWCGRGFKGANDRPRGDEKAHNRINRQWYAKKRNLPQAIIDDPKCHKNTQWRSILHPSKLEEIDWYPWFTASMQKLKGRPRSFGYETPYTQYYGHDGY